MRISRLIIILFIAVQGAFAFGQSERLLLAEGFYRRGMFDLAAPEYQAALKEEGFPEAQRPAVLFRLAECNRRTGRIQDAKRGYHEILTRYANDEFAHRARLQFAVLLLDEGRVTDALPQFESLRGSAVPPEIRDAAAYHLAACFEQTGKDEEAMRRYESIASGKSDYAEYAAMRLAWLLSRKGDAENMRKATGMYFDIALRSKDPERSAEAFAAAAQLAFAGEHWDESAMLFLKLRELAPEQILIRKLSAPAAWACYRSGRLADAQSILETALASRNPPQMDELLYLAANTARSLGQTPQAMAHYTALFKAFPKSTFTEAGQYEQLLLLYNNARYDEFIQLAESLETLPKGNEDRLIRMELEAATQLERFDDAISFASRLIKQYPESPLVPDAAYRLAWLYQKQEKWELAAQAYRDLVATWPQAETAPKACYAAAICMGRAGKTDEMLRELGTLLTRYPDDPLVPDALMLKAREEINQKQYQVAAVTLDELIRRFPESKPIAEALFWRGSLFRFAQDFGSAQDYLERAIRAGLPREVEIEAQLQRGHALQQLGRNAEAADLFQPLLEVRTREKIDLPKLRWLTDFQYRQERWDDALKAAQAMLSAAKTPADEQMAQLYLGRIYRAQKQNASALAAFRRVRQLAGEHPTAFAAEAGLRLGQLYREAGDDERAEDAFLWAVRQASAPEQRGIRAQASLALAEIAERQNRLEDALRLNMGVVILYDDRESVPPAMARAIMLLGRLNRAGEQQALIEELLTRYPDSAEAKTQHASRAKGEVAQ